MTRKIFSLTFYLIALVLISCAALTALLSFFLKDLKYYTELSFELLEKNSGYTVSITDINWDIVKGTGVIIDNLKITETASKEPLLSSKKVQIMTELLPLFKKELIVSRIILTEPELYVARGSNGQWRLLTLPVIELEDQKKGGKIFDYSVSIKQFFIRNGKLRYRDDRHNLISDFDHLNLQIRLDHISKKYSISLTAEHIQKKEPGVLSLQGDFSFVSNEIDFQKLSANAGLRLKSTAIMKFIPYIAPQLNLPGTSGILDADIKFELNPGWKWTAGGRIAADTLSVDVPGKKTVILKKCALKFNLKSEPGSLLFDRLELSLAEDITLSGELSITKQRDESAFLDLKLAGNIFSAVDLARHIEASEIVTAPYRGLLGRITDGKLSLKNFHLQGPVFNILQKQITDLRGELEIDGLVIEAPELIQPLRIDSICEIYNDNLWGTLAGQWLSDDLHTGHFEITSLFNNPCVDITIDSMVPSKSLNGVLPAAITAGSSNSSPLKALSGIVTGHTTISGGSSLQITSEIDLTRATYMIAETITKPAGLSNKLYLGATVAQKKDLGPFSFEFLLDNNLLLTGTIKGRPAPAIEGLYSLKALDINSLELASLPPDMQLNGAFSGKGSFQFPRPGPTQFPLQGSISMEAFEFKAKGSEKAFISADMQARLHENHLIIEKGTARVGETYLSVSGKLKKLLPPQGVLALDADFFDIDDFVYTVKQIIKLNAKKLKKPLPSEKSIFRRTDLVVNLKLKKTNLLGWDFGEGSTLFSFKNGVMLFDDINISAGNGIVNGTVIYDFSMPRRFKLELIFDRSDVDFLWCVPNLKDCKTIQGTLDLKGEFSSTFRKQEEIVPNMNGSFHVGLTDGELNKFATISKLLSLFNLEKIFKAQPPDLRSKGMPFDSLEADFVMKDTECRTENLILKSPAMNLSAVGSIHLLDKEIDFTVRAQILQTIGKIFGNIPVAKSFFRDKSLTISYFKVKGPYENPSISHLPIKSLSRAVINVFQSLLDIPMDIIKPKRKQGDVKEKPPLKK